MRFLYPVLAIWVVAAPLSLRAEGGRIEINAACASVGCFAGDTPGYPVTITAPGSYLLTSDLVLPAGVSGITILTDDVHVDLNDFTIRGPATCVQGACAQTASPRLVGVGRPTFGTGQGKRCSVKNGSILGIDGNGIALTNNSQVSHVQVASVTLIGIEMSGINALVERSTIDSTGSSGIVVAGGLADHPAVVRDNVLSNTNLSIAGTAISGTRSGGTGNSCDDGSCTKYPRYYLTKGTSDGAHTLTACAVGFHMASLWEIHNPAQLSYDTVLGYQTADAGQGMPSTVQGWIRTGEPSNTTLNVPGQANCGAWASNGSELGSSAASASTWNASPLAIGPWFPGLFACSTPLRVWCVED